MLLRQSEGHGNASKRTSLLEGAVWAKLRRTINKVLSHSAGSKSNHQLHLACRIALQWCLGPSIAPFPAGVQVIQIAATAERVHRLHPQRGLVEERLWRLGPVGVWQL